MLNILWVEDEYSEQKQIQWFKDRRVTVENNFDAAEKVINSDLNKYDVVVLDINLENSGHSENVKKYANSFGLKVHEFLEKSGMNLYFMLLENGFPKERIIFLTANANIATSQVNDLRQAFDRGDDDNFLKTLTSITRGFGDEEKNYVYQLISHPDGYDENDIEALCNYLGDYFNKLNEGEGKNTYEILRETANNCRIKVPDPCVKGTNQLDLELEKHESNKYLVLRRGVIEGCQYTKTRGMDNLYFNNYTLENESIQIEDIQNYFEILKNLLPLREPIDKCSLYKLFIRTLSHEWEAAKSIKLDKNKKEAVLAWVMRNTRHWITHNSILFNEVDENIIAYLFMVNMRVMFNFNDDAVHDYEEILLKLFDNEALDEKDFLAKKIPVSEAYIELKTIVQSENSNSESDQKIKDDYYFYKLTNNIQLSNSQLRHEKKLFIKLLYQTFWLTTSNPLSSTKDCDNLLDIRFYNFNYQSKAYLYKLARHIYHRSFPET